MAHKQPGLDGRHCDANGRISEKHGNTTVGTLHGIYGNGFAEGRRSDAKLSTVREREGGKSRHKSLKVISRGQQVTRIMHLKVHMARGDPEDVQAAMLALIERMQKSDEAVAALLFTVSTLVEIVNEISPTTMDKKLRELRISVQASEAGRVESKLTKQNRDQLFILESVLNRRVASQKEPPAK